MNMVDLDAFSAVPSMVMIKNVLFLCNIDYLSDTLTMMWHEGDNPL
jgi:hypothetical protein